PLYSCTRFFYCSAYTQDLHSFPTRRSSDLFLDEVDEECQKDDVDRRDRQVFLFSRLYCGATATGWVPTKEYESYLKENISLGDRSEEHTSELQSQSNLVCRLLLEKKKTIQYPRMLTMALRPPCPHPTLAIRAW